MFLNEKRPISIKKKNKSPPNLRQIDFNTFFKTKNEITDAYTQNLINAFGNKIKYLNNHKTKQSNSQTKTKNHIHKNTLKNIKINHKPNEIKQLNSFKDLNININTHININSPLSIPSQINYLNNNNNHNNNNINNTNSTSLNHINNNNIKNNSPQMNPEIISINSFLNNQDIPIQISNLNIEYKDFEKSKSSNKPIGNIRAYAANTYQGIIRDYNEDRVSITLNVGKPSQDYKGIWPKGSIFGIYDGHGGNTCADFLRDNIHSFIIQDKNFPSNPKNALLNGFQKAEEYFINNYALNKDNPNELYDKSGSCAIIALIIENKCYIANVGDSRAIISLNKGKEIKVLSTDHKPNEEKESKRIKLNGGKIYQTQTSTIKNINNKNIIQNQILIGPYRVLPGRLSVSRTIGDAEAKLPQFGGKKNVIISTPDITSFTIDNDIDFLMLGCDGIFDQLSNEEVSKCVWLSCDLEKSKEFYDIKNLSDQCSCCVDMIMKSSLIRKTFDNITVVMICFSNFEKEFNNKINLCNKDSLYQYYLSTEPEPTYNDEKVRLDNEDYDIDELDENCNKYSLKKETLPTSMKLIFKNNNITNFNWKKGKINKKNTTSKKNMKLPLSPKMKTVLKQNFFNSYLKK